MDSFPFFAAEARYVAELPSFLAESCGASSLGTNTMETLPIVRESFLPQGCAARQANRVDLVACIQSRLDSKSKMLGQTGYLDALSVIAEIPNEVRVVVRSNIASVVQGIMEEVHVMSDDICSEVSERHGFDAGMHARALASKSMEALPSAIRKVLDVHLAEAHVAMSRHVESVVKGLRSTHMSQQEFTEVAMNVSNEVQQILFAKVGIATQECFEDAQRRIDDALHSLDEAQSDAVPTRRQRRVPTAELIQATQNVLIGTVEEAMDKVEMMENESARANEAVAETLLRAKTMDRSEALAFNAGGVQEERTPNGADLCSASPISPKEIASPSAGDSTSVSRVAAVTDLGAADRGQPGSVGHPELCARPCAFVASGRCERGFSCDFCHMPHERRAVHLDKKGRDALKRMTHEERVAAILPVVRTKLIHMQLDEGLLQNITDISNALQPVTYTADVSYSMQNMQRRQLTKLTLRTLFLMMKDDDPHVSHSELQATVDRLFVEIKADVARRFWS
eukprot:TRINITY_DN6663_c0_g3_i1.p1 TRINITY_DN6663_c0_g3~~TRINITY_DN6663_c0_g3_i1.p1  ORF type:complete len:525 (-),score=77.00 TRINITY_DN6663_c0_g3_i1:345-1877(-)